MPGEGGGARRGARGGGPKRLYKAPTDNTRPQQTIESPDRLHKGPTDYTKTQHIRQHLQGNSAKPQNVRQERKKSTRVATHNKT